MNKRNQILKTMKEFKSRTAVSRRKYDKMKNIVNKQNSERLKYCYIPKKIKPKKQSGCLF